MKLNYLSLTLLFAMLLCFMCNQGVTDGLSGR